MTWLDNITNSMKMSLEQTPGDSEREGSLAAAVHEVERSWTRLIACATVVYLITPLVSGGDLERREASGICAESIRTVCC